MNILIPMAGRGSRFVDDGFSNPKPLIMVDDEPMIQKVINNLDMYGNYIFLVLQEHAIKFPELLDLLRQLTPNCKIMFVNSVTEGAACTCLLAKKFIDNNEPLLIANCDQIMDWSPYDFLNFVHSTYCDGCILTFFSKSGKNSYVSVNHENMLVTECKEKEIISELATCGVYYWSRGKDFVWSTEQMIKTNKKINNEFYVCPTYNELIDYGARIVTHHVSRHYPVGTPEDLKKYLELTNGRYHKIYN